MRHSCTVCRRVAEPPPAIPVHLRGKVKDVGDLIAMDTFTFADTSGAVELFLNQIDVATRFGIAVEISGVNSSGYSASRWVLGRGLPLPHDLLGSSSQLSLQTRNMEDRSFAGRISLLSSARRASLVVCSGLQNQLGAQGRKRC